MDLSGRMDGDWYDVEFSQHFEAFALGLRRRRQNLWKERFRRPCEHIDQEVIAFGFRRQVEDFVPAKIKSEDLPMKPPRTSSSCRKYDRQQHDEHSALL